MPPLEQMDRYDKAVLWPFAGYDLSGQPYVSQDGREEVEVRWEHRRQQVTDPQGNTVVIDGTVIIDRDVPVGSIMWEGEEQDIPGTAYTPTSSLFLVYASNKAEDLKGRHTRFELMLIRHSNTLPLGD